MQKPIILILFLAVFLGNAYAQTSLSMIIAPRIEKEQTGNVYSSIRERIKVNTATTFNVTFQKGDFFFELGIGVLQRYKQEFLHSGYYYTGGGSGELQKYDFWHKYTYNYTTLQPKLNMGRVLDLKRIQLFIGIGAQTDLLLNFKKQSSASTTKGYPFRDPRQSYYLKVNPRWTLPNGKLFIEINSLIGVARQHAPHILRVNSSAWNPKSLIKPFYQTGIGLGFPI
ncbi:MAG: hypothetical protein GQ574_05170 [Crocinitomix sp.]|nr:hypothetical protein [Crocinitomix sp.]